ncbi:hypothetical protein TNCV_1520721 [Trichonephila clavipes]|nr:hypothetical protein TNCV_1520721 [Trichonephila clavipes]
MKEGRIRSGYLPFRTNASTLPITSKQSSSRDVDVTVNEISKRAEKNEMIDIYQLVQGLALDEISDCALDMKTHCQENSQNIFLAAVLKF